MPALRPCRELTRSRVTRTIGYFSFAAYHASSRRWWCVSTPTQDERGVLQVIESLALRRRLSTWVMGPNARPQRTVTPVQRSNGVYPYRALIDPYRALFPPFHPPLPLVCVFVSRGVLLGCQLGARWCLASSLSCAST